MPIKKSKEDKSKKCINPWYKYLAIFCLVLITLLAIYKFNNRFDEAMNDLREAIPRDNYRLNVLITSTGVNLDSDVAVQFETSRTFLIVNPETERYICYSNDSGTYDNNWIKEFINKNDIAAVITGTMNAKTFETLTSADIEVYTGVIGNAKRALKSYEKHELVSSNRSIYPKKRSSKRDNVSIPNSRIL